MLTYDYEKPGESEQGDETFKDTESEVVEETVEAEPEPAPAPAPEPSAPAPDDPVEVAKWKAFCDGVDAAVKMYGGLCNKGHKRLMAKKAGYVVPEGE